MIRSLVTEITTDDVACLGQRGANVFFECGNRTCPIKKRLEWIHRIEIPRFATRIAVEFLPIHIAELFQLLDRKVSITALLPYRSCSNEEDGHSTSCLLLNFPQEIKDFGHNMDTALCIVVEDRRIDISSDGQFLRPTSNLLHDVVELIIQGGCQCYVLLLWQ